MSRAFVRESDDSREEPRPPRLQIEPGMKNHITCAGERRLRAELEELLERKKLLASSRDHPGRQTNPIDDRIRVLQQILDSVVVTAPPAAGRDRVCFGAEVLVQTANGEQMSYRIVGQDETEPERGHINWRSPLARALLSHRVGDTISFQAPSGVQALQIVSISYKE